MVGWGVSSSSWPSFVGKPSMAPGAHSPSLASLPDTRSLNALAPPCLLSVTPSSSLSGGPAPALSLVTPCFPPVTFAQSALFLGMPSLFFHQPNLSWPVLQDPSQGLPPPENFLEGPSCCQLRFSVERGLWSLPHSSALLYVRSRLIGWCFIWIFLFHHWRGGTLITGAVDFTPAAPGECSSRSRHLINMCWVFLLLVVIALSQDEN